MRYLEDLFKYTDDEAVISRGESFVSFSALIVDAHLKKALAWAEKIGYVRHKFSQENFTLI